LPPLSASASKRKSIGRRRVVVKAGTAHKRHAFGCPSDSGELGGWLETAVGDETKQHPLDDARLEASPRPPPATPRRSRGAPTAAEHERPAEAARVDDLDLAPRLAAINSAGSKNLEIDETRRRAPHGRPDRCDRIVDHLATGLPVRVALVGGRAGGKRQPIRPGYAVASPAGTRHKTT